LNNSKLSLLDISRKRVAIQDLIITLTENIGKSAYKIVSERLVLETL
ncbi:9934_t:CDS:1, partial [Funneliformis caledonium]